jgi:hypothetical protein
LSSVAFGPYLVRLGFDAEPSVIVTLEGSYEHVGHSEHGWVDRGERVGDVRLDSSRLMQLTNHEVVAAVTRRHDGFDWSSRTVRHCASSTSLIDDSHQYESMQIHHFDRLWII